MKNNCQSILFIICTFVVACSPPTKSNNPFEGYDGQVINRIAILSEDSFRSTRLKAETGSAQDCLILSHHFQALSLWPQERFWLKRAGELGNLRAEAQYFYDLQQEAASREFGFQGLKTSAIRGNPYSAGFLKLIFEKGSASTPSERKNFAFWVQEESHLWELAGGAPPNEIPGVVSNIE
jgi:hypothetical protein